MPSLKSSKPATEKSYAFLKFPVEKQKITVSLSTMKATRVFTSTTQLNLMKNALKIALLTVAGLTALASCSSNDPAPVQNTYVPAGK